MNLYLLRHGEAVPSNGTITDTARTLSERGRADIECAGRLLSSLTPSVGRVLSSPLVRAAQTAELISSVIPSHPVVSRTENLAPGFRMTSLVDELVRTREQHLLAVGHQPDLTGLISYLLSGPRLDLEMEPGAIAALEFTVTADGPAGRLRWLMSPALIRSLNGNR